MNQEKEVLDYCRVKKIFEKGFGFLTSLYYPQDVFFHFSKIKDHSIREKLNKLKRGEVYIFYTSEQVDKKRRVSNIWLDLEKVDKKLIPEFIRRIIEEFNIGKINPFELAGVVKILKRASHLNRDDFSKILHSLKVQKTPTVVIQMLDENDLIKFSNVNSYFENINEANLKSGTWTKEVLSLLFGK